MKQFLLLLTFTGVGLAFTGCNNQSNTSNSDRDSIDRRARLEAEVREEAKPAYIKAYKEISELKINVDLVDSGLLSARDVIAHYNRTVGLIMGQENSIDSIRGRISTAGDAYIDFVFKKEQARIANEKAADASFGSKKE